MFKTIYLNIINDHNNFFLENLTSFLSGFKIFKFLSKPNYFANSSRFIFTKSAKHYSQILFIAKDYL